MPYIDGKRVSQQEWVERFGTLRKLHTGPNGENPAPAPSIDEESGAPKAKKRSKRSSKQALAAIADAMGIPPEQVKEDA